MDKIIALAKRRGFFYPSSDIYGGLANTWDYGHYGVLLKNNIRDYWWKRFVLDRSDMVGLDSSIILNPKVWEASGHVGNFADPLIDCKECHFRTRADLLIEDKLKVKVEGKTNDQLNSMIKDNKIKCQKCGANNFTSVKKFNLLFETKIGIVEDNKSLAYLRGELAQGIFINFKNVINTNRVKLPFGIASVGSAFRNEITLGQSIFRSLVFDLMEFEYFIFEAKWKDIFSYWQQQMMDFAVDIGLNKSKLRWREHQADELSHYSKRTADLEYNYPFGFKEMWGLAYRTDYDLKNHSTHANVDLSYTDSSTGEKILPHVIEPTFGLSRLLITLLINSYYEEEVDGKLRTLLKINKNLAPIKVAIFPLQKNENLKKIAESIYDNIKKEFTCQFDDAGNIGKMYRRQDEIGTPFCVTIDFNTLEDDTVTIRERDTMSQKRVNINQLLNYLHQQFKS